MRFTGFFATFVAVASTVAAPTEVSVKPFIESAGELILNPAMYKTENFTASDGLTYEISYLSEVPDVQGLSMRSALDRRQQPSDDPLNRWSSGTQFRDSCRFGSISGDTGPNAPTTGRCAAVRDWCANNPGVWTIFPQDGSPSGFYPLISSGASGTTACHFAVRADGAYTQIGTDDVRDWARTSLDRYTRSFNGVYRVRSYGQTQSCNGVRTRNLWWRLDTLQGIGG